MKKALILLGTMSLILFYTLTATAETTKVYLDQMTNGTVSYDVTDSKWDSSLSIIGFEYLGERFKLGGELGFGSFETASTTDFNTIELTGGYRLINKNHFKLDAQITYQSNTLKSTDSADYSGIMCGGDMIIESERS